MFAMVRFHESILDHAVRLQVSRRFLLLRRRALVAKLSGLPLPIQTPHRLCLESAQELMQTLAVCEVATAGNGRMHYLAPAVKSPSADLLRGQHFFRRICGAQTLTSFAVDDIAHCRLPYGYCRDEEGLIRIDPGAGPVVQLTFALIIGLDNGETTPWAPVAAILNAAGHRTATGKPWNLVDVRSLTHVTAYAGYVRCNRKGLGDAVERLTAIPEPLVGLDTFVRAAIRPRGKTPTWLTALATATEQQEVGHLLPPAGRNTEKTHATAT